MSQKPHKKHNSPTKHHHHAGGAAYPSSGVDLMSPCRLRGSFLQRPRWNFSFHIFVLCPVTSAKVSWWVVHWGILSNIVGGPEMSEFTRDMEHVKIVWDVYVPIFKTKLEMTHIVYHVIQRRWFFPRQEPTVWRPFWKCAKSWRYGARLGGSKTCKHDILRFFWCPI